MMPFEVFEIVQQLIQIVYWIIRATCHILQILAAVQIIKPREDLVFCKVPKSPISLFQELGPMGTSDTQDLSSGYLAYLKKAASGVPSNFRYHHRHVKEVYFYSSQHEGSNIKSVFC